MPAKTLSGARCVVLVKDRPVGIFTNISYGLQFGLEPIYILGRHGPAETVYTSQEPVTVNASGWRTLDSGPHVAASLPRVQELLQSEYLSLSIEDRQTGRVIMKVLSARAVSFSTTVSARQAQEISVTFMGLTLDADESGTNQEVGATNLP